MTETPQPRELNPHVRFAAEQFGFSVTWEEGIDWFWYVKYDAKRESFFWREDEGVDAFFDQVREFFVERGYAQAAGY